MNRIVIVSLLALYCISSAPAQEEHTFERKLKEGIVYDTETRITDTYSGEKANLYRKSNNLHEFGDGFGKYSHEFPIALGNTAVTEDIIFVEYFNWHARLTLLPGENTFDFYQNLHSFDVSEFQRYRFYVEKVVQGGKTCENVTKINAKKLSGWKLWLLIAVDETNNKPRLIFSHAHLELKSCSRWGKTVYLTLKAIEKIAIKVEFAASDEAIRFLSFIKDPPINENQVTL